MSVSDRKNIDLLSLAVATYSSPTHYYHAVTSQNFFHLQQPILLKPFQMLHANHITHKLLTVDSQVLYLAIVANDHQFFRILLRGFGRKGETQRHRLAGQQLEYGRVDLELPHVKRAGTDYGL